MLIIKGVLVVASLVLGYFGRKYMNLLQCMTYNTLIVGKDLQIGDLCGALEGVESSDLSVAEVFRNKGLEDLAKAHEGRAECHAAYRRVMCEKSVEKVANMALSELAELCRPVKLGFLAKKAGIAAKGNFEAASIRRPSKDHTLTL